MLFEGFPGLVLYGSVAVLNCRTLTECGSFSPGGFFHQTPMLESTPRVAGGILGFDREDMPISSKSRWQCSYLVPDPWTSLEGTSETVQANGMFTGLLLQPPGFHQPHSSLPTLTFTPAVPAARMLWPSSLLRLASSCSLLWAQLKHTPSKEPFFLPLLSFRLSPPHIFPEHDIPGFL